jgi:hypothetical protein
MALSLTALFFVGAVALAIWIKRDPGFRKREFIGVSLFWIFFIATPWGAELIDVLHNLIGTGAEAASDTVNNLSQ